MSASNLYGRRCLWLCGVSSLLLGPITTSTAYVPEIYEAFNSGDAGLSPKGDRLLLHVVLRGEENDLRGHLTLVDLRTGRSVASFRRRMGTPTWSPSGRRLYHNIGETRANEPGGICLKVPQLGKAWALPQWSTKPAWSEDGENAFVAVRRANFDGWRLLRVGPDGKPVTLIEKTQLFPQRCATYRGQKVVLCANEGGRGQPVTLLRPDGSVLTRLGPGVGTHNVFTTPRMAALAWQNGDGGPVFIAREGAAGWSAQEVRLPSGKGLFRLGQTGADGLFLEDIGAVRPLGLWTLSWSGVLTALRWPPAKLRPDQHEHIQVMPGGTKLLRTFGGRVEMIDGLNGRVLKAFKVKLPPSLTRKKVRA